MSDRDLTEIAKKGYEKFLELVPEEERPLDVSGFLRYHKIVDHYCDNLVTPPLTDGESFTVNKLMNNHLYAHENLVDAQVKSGNALFNNLDEDFLAKTAEELTKNIDVDTAIDAIGNLVDNLSDCMSKLYKNNEVNKNEIPDIFNLFSNMPRKNPNEN